MTTVHLCKFKPAVKIYVLTSPGSMCSLICNTVRWHMDVSGEGEPLWPVARLPPSPSLSLRFCLSWSLSSSFPVLPSPLTFLCPSLSTTVPSPPPHPLCFLSYLLFMSEAGDAVRCTGDDVLLMYWDMNLHGNGGWASSSTYNATVLRHMVYFPCNIH